MIQSFPCANLGLHLACLVSELDAVSGKIPIAFSDNTCAYGHGRVNQKYKVPLSLLEFIIPLTNSDYLEQLCSAVIS